MSGFRLRALLEEIDFSSGLYPSAPNNAINELKNATVIPGVSADPKAKLISQGPDPTSASLLQNNNIWGNTDDNDFNLEYMDLDEFLTETGLVDANFSNFASPASQPTDSPIPPVNAVAGLDQLLSETNAGIPSPSSSEGGVVSVQEATQQALPVAQKDDNNNTPTAAVVEESAMPQQPQIGMVKKRKYKEDGEGLSDTAVVVVPGQEGFDPAHAKFAPEELQPQPIIKKSKKQFVPEDSKDEKYWKRRNKNNVAAKRSREARRAKENQIIMRAGFLESENEALTKQNATLLKENEALKKLVDKLQGQLKG